MTVTRALIVIVVLLGSGCGSSPSSPSTTTSTTPISEFFEAGLSPGDTTFFSFTVNTTDNVTVTLASIVLPNRPEALTIPLRIGIGTPAGEGCSVTDTVDAPPALTPQLTSPLQAGIHCVSIADAGQLTAPVIVSVRFSHR